MLEIILFILLVIVLAAGSIICLAVLVSYLTQASYVDPLDESYEDD
jgi:hypothetical protein